jgi:hypothetical protein
MNNKKKVLFVGDLRTYTGSYLRKCSFESAGFDVKALSSITLEIKEGEASFLKKIFSKFGFPIDYTNVNQKILQEVENNKFDLIWIEKGNTVLPKTLLNIKTLSPASKLVSFSEDNMILSHNRSLFYTHGIRHYDFVILTKGIFSNLDYFEKLSVRECIFIDQFYYSQLHKPVEFKNNDLEEFCSDIGFIGTYEKERSKSLLFVAQNNKKVVVWGNGWKRLKEYDDNLIVKYRAIYMQEYVKTICSTKINLCFLRKINKDTQTHRSFEIPACGGFMLAERTQDHLRNFTEDKEAVYFSSDKELLSKINYYLIHDDERRAIAQAGRERCRNSGYSFLDRLKDILVDIGING